MDKTIFEFGFNRKFDDVWLFQIAKLEYHNLTYLVCLLPVFRCKSNSGAALVLIFALFDKTLGSFFPFLFHLY
jgi:hypothetical protein